MNAELRPPRPTPCRTLRRRQTSLTRTSRARNPRRSSLIRSAARSTMTSTRCRRFAHFAPVWCCHDRSLPLTASNRPSNPSPRRQLQPSPARSDAAIPAGGPAGAQEAESNFEPWSVKREGILSKFTTSEKLSITFVSSGGARCRLMHARDMRIRRAGCGGRERANQASA